MGELKNVKLGQIKSRITFWKRLRFLKDNRVIKSLFNHEK